MLRRSAAVLTAWQEVYTLCASWLLVKVLLIFYDPCCRTSSLEQGYSSLGIAHQHHGTGGHQELQQPARADSVFVA